MRLTPNPTVSNSGSLRRSFAIWYRRQVSSEEVRRSIIGHAEEVETYTNVKEHEQRAAIGAVVRLVKGGE